jgi:hypothetical protein
MLDDGMADNVGGRETRERNARDAAESVFGFVQAGTDAGLEIDL